MNSIPEMYSSEKSSVTDTCSPNSSTDLSTKSKRDQEGEILMEVQEEHKNPRSLGYLHNFSDLIASSDIKPVDLNDTDVDSLWFGSGQIGNKASSSVLSGKKTATTEDVSGCQNKPSHSASAETAERSESGTLHHFLCPPIKVESDLVTENNLCDSVALEKIKIEADEPIDVDRSGTSANSFTANTNTHIDDCLHTHKGSEIMVLEANSEEIHTRIKTVPPPDDTRHSVGDSIVNGGGKAVRKQGHPRKQTNSTEVHTSKMKKVSPLENLIELDMDSTLENGGKTMRKQSCPMNQANYKSDTHPFSTAIVERRKSSRTPKPKKYSYNIKIDVDGDCSSDEEDSEEEWTTTQELTKSPVQIVPYKTKTPRKARTISGTATEKEMNQVFCKDCNAAFASLSDLKRHELICKQLKSTGASTSTTRDDPILISTASTNSGIACPVCHIQFAQSYSFRRHIGRMHFHLFHISCGLCHKSMGDLDNLYEHMKLHHQSAFPRTKCKKQEICPLCGLVFQKVSLVKDHLYLVHSNYLHLSCNLCQRNIGSSLDLSTHFSKYHRGDGCITAKPATDSDSICNMYMCVQCNKCLDSYTSLALHLLYHKINNNTESENKDLSTVGITCKQQEAPASNTALEEFPVSLSSMFCLEGYDSLTTDADSTFSSFGQELVVVLNRSLKTMTELSSQLPSELEWNSSAPVKRKDDLCKKLNTVLRLSSAITDIGKCLLLVVEENKRSKSKRFNPVSDREDGGFQDDFLEIGFNDNDSGDEEENEMKTDVGLKTESAKDSENQNEASVKDSSVGGIGCPGNDENATETQEILDDGDEGNNDGHVPALETRDKVSDVLAASENNNQNNTSMSEDVKPESTLRTRSSKRTGLSSDNSKKGKQTAKQKKKFICNICGKQLSRASKLQAHRLVHTDARPFKCKICLKGFKCEYSLKLHFLRHANDNKYNCDFCDFHHRLLKTLHEHMVVEHKDEKFFPCDFCNCKHQARTSYDLAIHKKLHEPKPCPHCDYKAQDHTELQEHYRKTHLEFSCPQCDYQCATNHQLKRHLKTHDEATKIKEILCCELCGKTFNTKSRLKYHMERHVNKTPFSCPHCDYKCSSKTSYRGHLMKHAGLRPYICKICGAGFRMPSHLKSHAVSHSDISRFECRFCSKGFKYQYNLIEHEMIHTGEKRFKCHLCDFGCQRKKVLNQHVEDHKARGSDVELSEHEAN